MRQRVIRFEIYNPNLDKNEGIFRAERWYRNLTAEERDEMCILLNSMPVPELDYHAGTEYEHYFTRDGYGKYKRLVKLLIKISTHSNNVRIRREWIGGIKMVWKDKYQIAIEMKRGKENGNSQMSSVW